MIKDIIPENLACYVRHTQKKRPEGYSEKQPNIANRYGELPKRATGIIGLCICSRLSQKLPSLLY